MNNLGVAFITKDFILNFNFRRVVLVKFEFITLSKLKSLISLKAPKKDSINLI